MTARDEALRALEKKFPDDGNGDEDAYNKGWNDCRERVLSLLSSRQEVAPVAYCDPSDPRNSHAFAWPGTFREERHATPLYTSTGQTSDARDGARYRWLKDRLLCADFSYGQGVDASSVIVFEWPESARISANLDESLDAAMRQEAE